MKKNIFVFMAFFMAVMAGVDIQAKGTSEPVSWVDTSMSNSQKYVLRVDGRPFYPLNVQVRFDKLRYRWGWSVAECDSIIKATAGLHFNTISVPIHWVEIEPEKNRFDWTTLDTYLNMAARYGLRVELLWFGQNSGGHVQWLTEKQLRTPDYVLHSPKAGNFQSFSTEGSSKETTSEFAILRSQNAYRLDLNDKRLMEREAYVVGRMMEHVAQWDKQNGNKHTVIGIQLNNEARSFPSDVVVRYMSRLGKAVKESTYPVWTRLNCVYTDLQERVASNERLRQSAEGTCIDFVGIDTYFNPRRGTFDDFVNNVPQSVPACGKNYPMIMEIGGEMANIAQMQVAALYGNMAMDIYELCGPDEHGFFVQDGRGHFKARGSYVYDDIAPVNRVLSGVMADIATKASGYGIVVHNWKGQSLQPVKGIRGITFTPASISSQGLTIAHSPTEIVLVATKGGTFACPSSLKIKEASLGYFDGSDRWVKTENVSVSKQSINVEKDGIVLLSVSE